MTIQEEAKALAEKFYEVTGLNSALTFDGALVNKETDADFAIKCAILHCQFTKKIWENDFYGMVLTQRYRDRCLQNAEHYTELLNELNKML